MCLSQDARATCSKPLPESSTRRSSGGLLRVPILSFSSSAAHKRSKRSSIHHLLCAACQRQSQSGQNPVGAGAARIAADRCWECEPACGATCECSAICRLAKSLLLSVTKATRLSACTDDDACLSNMMETLHNAQALHYVRRCTAGSLGGLHGWRRCRPC